ncbi:MAG: hypothetical protein WBW84_18540 [Acidobacteriaceae bacterium]
MTWLGCALRPGQTWGFFGASIVPPVHSLEGIPVARAIVSVYGFDSRNDPQFAVVLGVEAWFIAEADPGPRWRRRMNQASVQHSGSISDDAIPAIIAPPLLC